MSDIACGSSGTDAEADSAQPGSQWEGPELIPYGKLLASLAPVDQTRLAYASEKGRDFIKAGKANDPDLARDNHDWRMEGLFGEGNGMATFPEPDAIKPIAGLFGAETATTLQFSYEAYSLSDEWKRGTVFVIYQQDTAGNPEVTGWEPY